MKDYERDAAKLEILEEIWQDILGGFGTGELGGYECQFCDAYPTQGHEDGCLMPRLIKVMRDGDKAAQAAARARAKRFKERAF
jgi:hypothetical protein